MRDQPCRPSEQYSFKMGCLLTRASTIQTMLSCRDVDWLHRIQAGNVRTFAPCAGGQLKRHLGGEWSLDSYGPLQYTHRRWREATFLVELVFNSASDR